MNRRPPLEHVVPHAGLAQFAAQHRTRRQVLTAAGGSALVAALAACAPPLPPAGGTAALELPEDVSATEKVVNWANWTAYLDFDDQTKTYPTLEAFKKKYGMQAGYYEDIDDNDSYFNKIAPQLRAGQDISRDIFTFTDWMANRVIRDRLCQPLELIRIPNAANLLEGLKEVSFDPGRQNSLTWQSGFGGFCWDKSKVPGGIKTLDDLWQPELKGRIVVLSEYRDTLGVIMLSQGVDISKDFTEEQFQAAADVVSQRISDGYIRRVRGNAYLQDLQSGNAIAGIVWSGDIFSLRAETENDNWQFAMPETGGTLWSDNLMVPITARHRRNAMTLMNYYYDPAVAAQVAAYVNYVCPVQGAQKEMEKIDPDLAESPFIFPTEEFLDKNAKGFRALSPEEEAKYDAIWQRVVGN